jgi:nucleoside-diphosphate-sugar epimerase
MKFLVTGGTGFIGSHFVSQAMNAGHQVICIRRTLSSRPKIKFDNDPIWINNPLEQVPVTSIMGCDVLIHFAAHSVHYPYDSLSSCLNANLTAPLCLFETARRAGIRKFLIAGSFFEYGKSSVKYIYVPSSAPLEPTNNYGASKAAASIAFKQWAIDNRVGLTLIRIFHVFGDGESCDRFWPMLKRAALEGKDFSMTKGEQVREFLPVEDVAAAFLRIATDMPQKENVVDVFNLGNGHPTTLRQFAEYWWYKWGAVGSIRFGDVDYREGEVMRCAAGPALITVPSN